MTKEGAGRQAGFITKEGAGDTREGGIVWVTIGVLTLEKLFQLLLLTIWY